MTYDKVACDRYRAKHPEKARAAFRAWYAKNREYAIAEKLRHYGVRQAYLDSLKVGGCVDCGNKNLAVLDFDHVRGEKVMGVSKMLTYSMKRIDAEVAKCEVRCANCHRIVTAARRKAS